MTILRRHLDILCNYHDDYVAFGAESLGRAGGGSGATFWKVRGPRGTFCLRRWSSGYPTLERLQFIHAVQWHAKAEGFIRFPMPIETLEGMTYVSNDGHFWQLEPWMPGKTNFRKHPSTSRLVSAMVSLAEFHSAVKTFPLVTDYDTSATSLEHEKLLLHWTESRLQALADKVRRQARDDYDEIQNVLFISDLSDSENPVGVGVRQVGNTVTIPYTTRACAQERLQRVALRVLPLVRRLRQSVLCQVVQLSNTAMPQLPCLYDIHNNHLFFEKEHFQGFVDFGSLCVDTPTVDIARLLNVLTGSHPSRWLVGLAAYQSIRPLSPRELIAVQVFRRSTLLTTVIRWLDYIFMREQPVKCSAHLVNRLDALADMLERV